MESNKSQMEIKLPGEGYTYIFETSDKMGLDPVSKFRKKIWQIVPSVCATLMCLPFGLMLGWPSVTYPVLTDSENSPILLSWDQTAMVAGFLMIGNTVGIPFSSLRVMESKYGIITGVTIMTIGWVLMWQVRDIYWFLGSRFLVGAGSGFGVGQLKYYISEICQDSLSTFLIKQINLYIFFGMTLAFSYGPFVDFTHFSIIATIISILVLFLAIFLPSTPRELLRNGKTTDAKKLILFLSPHLDVNEEMNKIKEKINSVDDSLSFFDVMKNSSLRKNFVIFAILVLFQQFSGAPSTLIYCQIIFREFHTPRPELCAIIYSVTFLLANIYGVYCVPNHNKKHVFLFSCVGICLLLILKIIVLVQRANDTFWPFTSLLVLLGFIIVHTIGLGNIPFSLISELFPRQAHRVIVHFFGMCHSMGALIITKIFQVMFFNVGLFAPFCLFLIISIFSIIFVIIFVPSKRKTMETT